jgi:hypothetical protein
MTTSAQRRQLLRITGMTAIAAQLSSLLSISAFAADSPLVNANDPAAAALKYVDDAAKAADAKAQSKCANCSLYQGAAGSVQGPCALFPGKQVMSTGWCAAWVAKA